MTGDHEDEDLLNGEEAEEHGPEGVLTDEEYGDDGLDDQEPPMAPEQPIVTSDDAMTLEEARTVTGRRGGRLALLMGEVSTGKTGLMAALWQRFLDEDGLAEHRLAGSRTSLGFERRAHWARLEAQQPEADFPRTWAEDGGVLHLRVRRPDGERVELLLSDLAGEQFQRIRKGRPLLDELPWAGRADRFLVVIDGITLSRPGESEIPLTRAMRQLQALSVSGAVRLSARVALLVTQRDAVSPAGEAALGRHEPGLLDLAHKCDPESVRIETAAVPRDGTDPMGLDDLIVWLCSDDRPHPQPETSIPQARRSLGLFQA